MEKKKDKREVFIVKIFYLLLISYMVLYISKSTGYADLKSHRQVELNEEAIKKFEEDIKNGKDITVKDYLKSSRVKYNNNMSDIGYTISKQIGTIITGGIDSTMELIEQLFK